jgi:hypothetical protein
LLRLTFGHRRFAFQLLFVTLAMHPRLLLSTLAFGLFVTAAQAANADDPAAKKPLKLGDVRCDKVLFLGNSITLHGPLPSIGWTGNWGMAASAAEKDYVALVTAKIAKAAGGNPEIMVRNIADFERGFATYDVASGLKKELAFDADVIIVAIGENVPALTKDDDQQKFATAFAALLKELKADGAPTIIVRSSFWADATKDGIMKQASSDAGGTYVDIGALGKDDKNFARSERKIEHAGVANHPGDRGMQAIADAISTALHERTAAKTDSTQRKTE